MNDYHIGSVNAQNVQIGDHNRQDNTTVTIDELARLTAAIHQHAALLPDLAATHRALDALRVACTTRPIDPRGVARAADALSATAVAAPPIQDEIARLTGHIAR